MAVYLYTYHRRSLVIVNRLAALAWWFSLVPDSAEEILFISGLADIILIGWMCPQR